MVQFPIPQTIKTDFLSQFSLREGVILNVCQRRVIEKERYREIEEELEGELKKD